MFFCFVFKRLILDTITSNVLSVMRIFLGSVTSAVNWLSALSERVSEWRARGRMGGGRVRPMARPRRRCVVAERRAAAASCCGKQRSWTIRCYYCTRWMSAHHSTRPGHETRQEHRVRFFLLLFVFSVPSAIFFFSPVWLFFSINWGGETPEVNREKEIQSRWDVSFFVSLFDWALLNVSCCCKVSGGFLASVCDTAVNNAPVAVSLNAAYRWGLY